MRDNRPDAGQEQLSASALSVARVAQEKAARLFQDVLLRDALIADLQARVSELEMQLQRPTAGGLSHPGQPQE